MNRRNNHPVCGYNPCVIRVLALIADKSQTGLSADITQSQQGLEGKNKKSQTPSSTPGGLQGGIACVCDFHIYSFFLFLFIYINNLRGEKIADKNVCVLTAVIGGEA